MDRQVAAVAVDLAAEVALGLPPVLRLVLGEAGAGAESEAAHWANVERKRRRCWSWRRRSDRRQRQAESADRYNVRLRVGQRCNARVGVGQRYNARVGVGQPA